MSIKSKSKTGRLTPQDWAKYNRRRRRVVKRQTFALVRAGKFEVEN